LKAHIYNSIPQFTYNSAHIDKSVSGSMKTMTEFFKEMYPIIEHMKDTEQ